MAPKPAKNAKKWENSPPFRFGKEKRKRKKRNKTGSFSLRRVKRTFVWASLLNPLYHVGERFRLGFAPF
jgi:hypothetical protein